VGHVVKSTQCLVVEGLLAHSIFGVRQKWVNGLWFSGFFITIDSCLSHSFFVGF
jgi:hypothetical protein